MTVVPDQPTHRMPVPRASRAAAWVTAAPNRTTSVHRDERGADRAELKRGRHARLRSGTISRPTDAEAVTPSPRPAQPIVGRCSTSASMTARTLVESVRWLAESAWISTVSAGWSGRTRTIGERVHGIEVRQPADAAPRDRQDLEDGGLRDDRALLCHQIDERPFLGPGEGRELRPLIRIHDPGRAEAMDRLVQGLDAEVDLERVRDAPGQDLAGEPVHDGDEIEVALSHRQIGDVGAPDLIGPFHPQPAQQVGVGLMPLRRSAGVGLLVDRHQPHEAHQPPDALFVHGMAFVLQVPRHLPDPIERGLEELLVDHPHQSRAARHARSAYARRDRRRSPACPAPQDRRGWRGAGARRRRACGR